MPGEPRLKEHRVAAIRIHGRPGFAGALVSLHDRGKISWQLRCKFGRAGENSSSILFLLTTGRLVFHFHTRTKTGRSPPLQEAAPDDFLQVAEEDAERLGIQEGDWIKVTSRRGTAEAQARVGGITPSHLFVPFHFGYWDNPGRTEPRTS